MNRFVMAVMVASGLAASAAHAALTCDGDILITYPSPQASYKIGDVVQVRVTFGTGDILGGTLITLPGFAFDLDCDPTAPLVPPCTDDGPVISYNGDSSITTSCPGVTWTSSNPAGGTSPNGLIFTPSPALTIPPDIDNPPGFCSITFSVTIESNPSSGSNILELVSYGLPPEAPALCDNGLDSGGFQTAALNLAAPTDYDCYETPTHNTLVPPEPVTLVDRFGSTTSVVTNYHRLCAPADKNGDNPNAPSLPGHYAAGTLTKTTGTINMPKGLKISYQFGTITADLTTPVFLFLPAGKNPDHTMPAPPPPGGLRHLQCYRLSNVSGNTSQNNITVIDQFEPSPGLKLNLKARGPWRLCVPVDKNGGDPTAPDDLTDDLLCNNAEAQTPFGSFDVNIDTQFGQHELIGTQYDDLCMPATVSPHVVASATLRKFHRGGRFHRVR